MTVDELVLVAADALKDLQTSRAHPEWFGSCYSHTVREAEEELDLWLDALEEALGVGVSCRAHVEVGVEDESRVTGRGVGQVDVAEYLDT